MDYFRPGDLLLPTATMTSASCPKQQPRWGVGVDLDVNYRPTLAALVLGLGVVVAWALLLSDSPGALLAVGLVVFVPLAIGLATGRWWALGISLGLLLALATVGYVKALTCDCYSEDPDTFSFILAGFVALPVALATLVGVVASPRRRSPQKLR
jgi:hypothetical protein